VDVHSIVFRARLPIVVLALFLGVIVYFWARELYGSKAGLLALALLTFDPNIMAHGSLATNDLGLACFATLSAYTFWRWLKQPSWSRALVATLALGLAQSSKFSAVFLIPSLALTAVIHWFLTPVEERRPRKPLQLLGWLALIGFVMAFIVWAIYGFKMGQLRGGSFQIPAAAYFNEIRAMMTRIEQGNPTFLLGSYSKEGWWYYFPVAFAVKTPLPTLIMIIGSFIFAWKTRALQKSLPLLIPVIIYFLGSMIVTLNIGYRHLLPILPLLFIFVGQLAEIRWKADSKMAWAMSVLIVWLAVGTWSIFPHYLAYFNEIAGGPEGGKRVLVDSNLDWGQDLIGLREYMQREGIETVKLGYFGSAYPEAYGINYDPLPGFIRHWWPYNNYPAVLANPSAGVYAISVTNLEGALFPNHELYSWFLARKPDAMIGYSIYIYRFK
jgi:4-amino-4-deoxy-L-arabinose transferase-like glycosyltransferase